MDLGSDAFVSQLPGFAAVLLKEPDSSGDLEPEDWLRFRFSLGLGLALGLPRGFAASGPRGFAASGLSVVTLSADFVGDFGTSRGFFDFALIPFSFFFTGFLEGLFSGTSSSSDNEDSEEEEEDEEDDEDDDNAGLDLREVEVVAAEVAAARRAPGLFGKIYDYVMSNISAVNYDCEHDTSCISSLAA